MITLAQVKELLGIEETTYDVQIAAKIPYVVQKVKAITRKNWNDLIYGDITEGSPYVPVYLTNKNYDDALDYILPGSQVTGEGIPEGAYVEEVYPYGRSITNMYQQIKLSTNATASGNGIYLYMGLPIGYLDIVAKGIWYLISNTSTALPAAGVTSRRLGPASWSYSNAVSANDGKDGMPGWFVAGLPRYMGAL